MKICVACGTGFLREGRHYSDASWEKARFCSRACHNEGMRGKALPADQLRVRVDRSGGLNACWPWTGARSSRGYGTLYAMGTTLAAHRVAFEVATGESPGNLFVLHRCDNPPCCNPAHLFLGTHDDNMRDRDAKGRKVPARGEASGHAKLTEAEVLEIRRRAPGESARSLAEAFRVSRQAVRHVIVRRTWRHI